MKLQTFAADALRQGREAITRFPAVVLLAWLGTAAAMVSVQLDHQGTRLPAQMIVGALAGMTLAFAVALRLEQAPPARTRPLPSFAVGLLVAAGLTLWLQFAPTPLPHSEALRVLTLLLAGHLLVAVRIGRTASDDTFWWFNVRLFLRFLLGGLYAVVLFGGLALALLSCDRLLNLDIADKTYAHLWLLVTGGFHPLFFLAGVPPSGEGTPATRPEPLRKFVLYVLVPLTALYLAILYLYAARIIFTWDLPNGWVGLPVLMLALIGLLAVLLLYPWSIDDHEPGPGRLSRGFHLLTLPLTGLLALSIGRRVADYGVTEPRYYVVLLTVWLALTCVVGAWRPRIFLRWVPWSLAALALFASTGPWGAAAWSRQAQQDRVARYLQAGGLLDADGRLQAYADERAGADFDPASLRSTWRYLERHHGHAALAAWMAGRPAAPGEVMDQLGVPHHPGQAEVAWQASAHPAYLTVPAGPAQVHNLSLHRPGAVFRHEGWQLRLTIAGLLLVAPDGEEVLTPTSRLVNNELSHAWPLAAGPVNLQVLNAHGRHVGDRVELLNAQVLLALPLSPPGANE
jgi:hypothetical protein